MSNAQTQAVATLIAMLIVAVVIVATGGEPWVALACMLAGLGAGLWRMSRD